MIEVADLLRSTDWAEHWRGLVQARQAEVAEAAGTPRQPEEFWRRHAAGFGYSMRGQPDPFLDFLDPYLSPTRTLIDVGAGQGRHCVPLAARLDWVTAVEPAEAMRERIPPVDNLTLIGSRWEDAEPAPADLVICSHVLYAVADVVPFVEKLERYALERVFVYLRDGQLRHPADWLWSELRGAPRTRTPEITDLFLVLHGLGRHPDLTPLTYPAFLRFADLETAVEQTGDRMGGFRDPGERVATRAWLEANLRPDPEGGWILDQGIAHSGVLHWRPPR